MEGCEMAPKGRVFNIYFSQCNVVSPNRLDFTVIKMFTTRWH